MRNLKAFYLFPFPNFPIERILLCQCQGMEMQTPEVVKSNFVLILTFIALYGEMQSNFQYKIHSLIKFNDNIYVKQVYQKKFRSESLFAICSVKVEPSQVLRDCFTAKANSFVKQRICSFYIFPDTTNLYDRRYGI